MKPEELAAWRGARGWTDDQAARYLGVNIATWRNWQAGRRAPPDVALRLINVLSLVETLAPELAGALHPGEPAEHKRSGRKPKGAA